MLLHNHPLFQIYFGNAKDEIPNNYQELFTGKNMLALPVCAPLKKAMQLKQLIFLKQVHGADGLTLNSEQQVEQMRSFVLEGDYLATALSRCGIGVMTADCLPIVLYDSVKHATAVVHAGWRGSLRNVGIKAFEAMQEQYGTQAKDAQVFFGPSAKVCCYQVDEDFLRHFEDIEFLDQVVQRRGDAIYFDLPRFNRLLLRDVGIKKEQVRLEYNLCTMCDESFYSYRRQGQKSGRQMTVVSLK